MIDHFGITVSDLEKSKGFYTKAAIQGFYSDLHNIVQARRASVLDGRQCIFQF